MSKKKTKQPQNVGKVAGHRITSGDNKIPDMDLPLRTQEMKAACDRFLASRGLPTNSLEQFKYFKSEE